MHKRVILATLIFLCLPIHCWSGGTSWNELDRTEKNLFLLSSAALIADWGQSLDLTQDPDDPDEGNILLGTSPSRETVHAYFGACLIGNYLMVRYLPEKPRKGWLYFISALEVYTVGNNFMMGAKINF